jgi:hypothetical protein
MPRKSSLMSGVWKRSMARLVRHRPTKGPATDMPNPNHRVTPRLSILPNGSQGFLGGIGLTFR